MKTLPLLLCCLLAVQTWSHGVEINVGGTRLEVPAPEGFVLIPDNTDYAKLARRAVPATNEQYAIFATEADAALATKGGIPAAGRTFFVQVMKSVIHQTVSDSDFAQVKALIKNQNEEMLKQAAKDIPGLLDQVNKGISEDFKVDVNLTLNKMVPMPVHLETDRAMAYTLLMKFNANGPDGSPTEVEGVVTATLVHLKGKILFFYANSEVGSVNWSREAAKKWVDAAIAANPSSASSYGTTGGKLSLVDQVKKWWGTMTGKVVIGGIIGGLIGALSVLFRKKTA